jgi:hypothetical protein
MLPAPSGSPQRIRPAADMLPERKTEHYIELIGCNTCSLSSRQNARAPRAIET